MVSAAERVNFFYLLNFNSFIFKFKQSQWLALNVVDSTASAPHYSTCPWARSTGFTWDHIRDADSRVPLQTYCIRIFTVI